MPELFINGRKIVAREHVSVLTAAREAGIEIPTLCFHASLSPVGSCRLCLVEIDNYFPGEGTHTERAACCLAVQPGMVVETESAEVVRHRRQILQLLLQSYQPDSQSRPQDNELLRWANHYGVERIDLGPEPSRYIADSDPHPLLRIDLNQCILCTRCVRVCHEVQGRSVWHLADHGAGTHVVPGVGTTMQAARCESCGACAAVCPTGAISDRKSYGAPPSDRHVTTTCGYCGVGCQFDFQVRDDRIVQVRPNPTAPVNGISLCVKGRYGFNYIHHPDRLTRPRVREYLLSGEGKQADANGVQSPWVDVEWSQAISLVADRLTAIRTTHGPDATGWLSSAKCTNEENYLLQKLARQVIGTNNIDHCARLCHASTVAGLAMSLGSGAMSNSLDDVANNAAAVFIIGSNTTEQHPVFGAMLRQAVQRRGCQIVVADPRRIDITEFATLHIVQRPGTDVALLNGLMHIILREGWQNNRFIQERCENFDALRESLLRYTPEYVSSLTGVNEEVLLRAADLLANTKPMAVIWAMGITQHTTGVMNVLALANLQLLLGNFGMPGAGVNPLRGQNNVQGACDMGALPNLFPGYQAVTNNDACQRFDVAWRLHDTASGGEFAVPTTPGLTVTEMIERSGRGELKALYILGEDPALTEPDGNHARQSLAKSEFLVLQEILSSETSKFADVLLPGVSFAEKSGTFTNTERRVQLVRPAVPAPGDAWQDWRIVQELAQALLTRQQRSPATSLAGWRQASPAEVMEEIAAVTPIYGGVSHARLEASERLQWPVTDAKHPGTPILHVQQFTRGRGKFHVVEHLPPAELPDAEFPWLLTTGRVLYHWHGGELTRRDEGLAEICPEPLVEIHPEDALRLGIKPGDGVQLISRRGEMDGKAQLTTRVSPGILFANFHFAGQQSANNLTHRVVDPVAKIPEYKVCAVMLRAITDK